MSDSAGNLEMLARTLFCCENPPGTVNVAGSQDAIGVVLPGPARAYCAGGYWPGAIEKECREATLQLVEESLRLLALGPREDDFDPLAGQRLSGSGAQALSEAAENCWRALLAHGAASVRSFAGPLRRNWTYSRA